MKYVDDYSRGYDRGLDLRDKEVEKLKAFRKAYLKILGHYFYKEVNAEYKRILKQKAVKTS